MKRRAFLELLAAGTVVGQTAFAQELVPPDPQRILLTVAGINAKTSPDALGALLAALVVEDTPVNLVIETHDEPLRLRADSDIGRLIVRYIESFPGLVEAVTWCPELGRLSAYEAARQASEARKGFFDALYAGSPDRRPSDRPLLSIACKASLDSIAASATLASGFRTVLEIPDTSAGVVARLDRFGVLSILGGERTRLQDLAARLSRPVPGLQRHFILMAADISQTPADLLLTSAHAIGDALKQATLGLENLAVLASDIQMRTDVQFRRRVAVQLLEPADKDAVSPDDLLQIQQLLKTEGLPFSFGKAPPVTSPDAPADLSYWVPLALVKDGSKDSEIVFEAVAAEQLALARPKVITAKDTRLGVVVHPLPDTGSAGLTADATLNIPIVAFAGAPGRETASVSFRLTSRSDGILLISALALKDPALRAAFVRTIRQAIEQRETRFMSLETFCAETLPQDPLLPALLLTRAKAFKDLPGKTDTLSTDRAALLDDARAAWAYFARHTNTSTGLCPVTLVGTKQPVADYLAVSMWEVGSHINALLAAADLGLVEEKEFRDRCQGLLRAVERASGRHRLRLPPETIDAKSGKGTTRFNSFDTGRLLIALHRLRQHRFAPKGVEALVASWDFEKIITERRLHSYRGGKMIDDFASNYTDYAAQGARLWGFDVASPFDELADLATADKQARLLATTVSFGVLGAEPCFLHLLELPPSPSAVFLADCLDAIQSRLAEATGVPAAPSESPLDRSPWFTYQGFDLNNLSDPWVIEYGEKNQISAVAALSLRATSTKAAYLWHALRPNDHSSHLIRTLRVKARKENGFDSALYVDRQMSTDGYTDLNTNAVILQSIAHIFSSNR